MKGASHNAIDHLKDIGNDPVFGHRLQYLLPKTGERPASKLLMDTRQFAEFLRQVPPKRSGAGNPENAIKNRAVIGGFASVGGADGEDKSLK